MRLTEQLLVVARAYCAGSGRSLSRASTLVFNDGKKLDGIEKHGVDLSTGKFEFAMQWFSANWPEGAVWPNDVKRPEAAEAAEAGR